MTKVRTTGPRNEVTSSVGSFLANLPEMLGAMRVDPRCLVAVIEFEDGRYVQFWVTPNGRVFGEVISNVNIRDAVALRAQDEEKLRAGGWEEPLRGPRPNWRFEANDGADFIRLVTMTREAVLEVLAETSDRKVSVRTWSMDTSNGRADDELMCEGRVHYQETLWEIEGCLHDV